MPWVESDKLIPGLRHPQHDEIYNGLDCCITLEVFEEINRTFNQEPDVYHFERALQAPAMAMMLKGILIDQLERERAVAKFTGRIRLLTDWLNEQTMALYGRTINPRSADQLKALFYGHMKLPEQWISQKGIKKLAMNREVMEKLEVYLPARMIIATILGIRIASKKLEVLNTSIDNDGRWRTGYNIAGTESGRWSSSESATGTGRNSQNIDPETRRMFVADLGWKICGIDLEQAESREVGLQHGILFDDWRYLEGCLSGDLHTMTSKLIWPDLPWTGQPGLDRKIADQTFYLEFSYRDMAKRGGHGTSYMGTPWTMSRHLKVPVKLMVDFQHSFFGAYPAFTLWHQWCAQQLQTTHMLTTPFGRERHFFGHPKDEATIREAVAYVPQSSTADRLNLAMWRMWHRMPQIHLMAQVHDAIYFQYKEEDEEEVIPRALGLISTPIQVKGRIFDVPGEAKAGWNWANFNDDEKRGELNLDGLKKWKGSDTRKRTPMLDRIM